MTACPLVYYIIGKSEFEERYKNEPEILLDGRPASGRNSCFLYRIYRLSRTMWDRPGIGTGAGQCSGGSFITIGAIR